MRHIILAVLIIFPAAEAEAARARRKKAASPPAEVAVSTAAAPAADPEEAGRRALVRAAWKLAARVHPEPRRLDAVFHPSFFKHIPPEEVSKLLKGMHAKYGPVVAVSTASFDAAGSGNFIFHTDKGFSIPASISVDPEKGRLTGVFFRPAYQKTVTFGELKDKIAALPGKTSFLLTRYGELPGAGEGWNEDVPLAVGSAFKLYLLGALVEEDYDWGETLQLKERLRSLPSGRMAYWPAEAPVTLHTLAAAMISESDNTATDLILDRVGRKRVEKHLGGLGLSDPGGMTPFLSTADMFRLRISSAAAERYLSLPAAERYRFLDKELPRVPLSAAALPAEPRDIDRIEWFASASDLCRVMDYFRKKNDGTALDILAINPGLSVDREKLPYAGYKGGSEKGVISMTWLLKKKDGSWYCLSSSWNDPKSELDEKEFFGTMQSALDLLAQ